MSSRRTQEDTLLLLEFPVAGGQTGHIEAHVREAMEEATRMAISVVVVVVVVVSSSFGVSGWRRGGLKGSNNA